MVAMMHRTACAQNASEFTTFFGNELTDQSFSLDGTHATGPD